MANFAENVQALVTEKMAERNVLEDLRDVTDVLVTEVNLKHRLAARRERAATRVAIKELVQEALESGEPIQVSLGDAARELAK